MYLTDRGEILRSIKDGEGISFVISKILHNICNPDDIDWEILLNLFDLLFQIEDSHNFLSDLVFASLRMIESKHPCEEIRKELRKRFDRLDPNMPVDDPYLLAEMMKRFRAALL